MELFCREKLMLDKFANSYNLIYLAILLKLPYYQAIFDLNIKLVSVWFTF